MKREKKAQAGVLPPPDALARFGRLVGLAVKEGATAIHVGPVFDEETQRSVPRLALRVGGSLTERERLGDDDYRDLLARVRQMADLDLAEQRLPQEGRMMLSLGGKEVDLLVNLSPTALGERLCLRILAPGERRPELSDVLPREALDAARRWLARPWGLVVLCGAPAVAHRGLYYAVLAEARSRGHVASVEDAVESTLSGVTQIQTDRRIGLTPARAIRAAMRQDPNVLGIGDLREAEEAELAVEATLTGHVVVAQVSATDAAAALARLSSWVFDTAPLARALAGVLARRLDDTGEVSFDALDASDAVRAGILEGRSVAGLRELIGAARG